MSPPLDLSPLRKALGKLKEASQFWQDQPDGSALKPHLRSAVIQSFALDFVPDAQRLLEALESNLGR